MTETGFTIGRLAAAAGVNVETVRYYQRIKLMPVPKKASGGIRRYGPAELARLKFIKTAQGLGFTLEEIAELVKLDEGTHCKEAHAIAVRKRAAVRQRIADLARIEAQLSALIERCAVGRGTVSCPLIAALARAGE
jgi:MerR family mercuric resistance operon transcriptional regulator